MTEVVGSFRTSSFSDAENNCVEVAATGGRAVRDSKDQAGPMITFAPGGWQAFLVGAKAGGFGRPARS